mmetsp:Transcript_9178/g.13928  ORF Transcript_9178/g.13928 Transcript_9178/m.13928 type:complete len:212 (-) Transcript_9178:34-669(-)
MGFVRKVYGILTTQLFVTGFFCVAIMNNFLGVNAILLSPAIVITAVVGSLVTCCALVCCGLDKKVPLNYALLGLFTACESLMVGIICLSYNPQVVMEAALLTGAVCLAITLYAMNTKSDFTIFGPIVWILGFIFGMVGILGMFFGFYAHLIYAGIGVFLFSFYLLIDTQMIIGGKNRRYKIDEESYILAAMSLYLDIINIFIYILQLLGDR